MKSSLAITDAIKPRARTHLCGVALEPESSSLSWFSSSSGHYEMPAGMMLNPTLDGFIPIPDNEEPVHHAPAVLAPIHDIASNSSGDILRIRTMGETNSIRLQINNKTIILDL